MEADPVSKMFCLLEYWIMDKSKNPVTLAHTILCHMCKYKAYLKYTYTDYGKGPHCQNILLNNTKLNFHTLHKTAGSKQNFEYIHLPRDLPHDTLRRSYELEGKGGHRWAGNSSDSVL
jgi:hypothetical protein